MIKPLQYWTTKYTTMLSRTAPRAIPRCSRASSSSSSTQANILGKKAPSARTATASYQSRASQKQQHLSRSLIAIAGAGGLATLSQFYINDGQFLRTDPKVGYVVIDITASEEQAAAVRDELAAIPGTLRTRILY